MHMQRLCDRVHACCLQTCRLATWPVLCHMHACMHAGRQGCQTACMHACAWSHQDGTRRLHIRLLSMLLAAVGGARAGAAQRRPAELRILAGESRRGSKLRLLSGLLLLLQLSEGCCSRPACLLIPVSGMIAQHLLDHIFALLEVVGQHLQQCVARSDVRLLTVLAPVRGRNAFGACMQELCWSCRWTAAIAPRHEAEGKPLRCTLALACRQLPRLTPCPQRRPTWEADVKMIQCVDVIIVQSLDQGLNYIPALLCRGTAGPKPVCHVLFRFLVLVRYLDSS